MASSEMGRLENPVLVFDKWSSSSSCRTSVHWSPSSSEMAFCERRLPMAKLILLVALAFSITTGSITLLVLNPQPAMACPGNNGH